MPTTKKLVYSDTLVSVKPHDVVETEQLGRVVVHNVHAPRKHSGQGRVTLDLPDGRTADYTPADIGAKWI